MVEISRFEAALRRRPRLQQRCFSPGEREYCNRQRRPGQHFAARFAAKEAVAKALAAPVRWREIEVTRHGGATTSSGPPRSRRTGQGGRVGRSRAESSGGAPGVRLSGRTAELAAGRAVLISISHSGDLAVAAAVAERADE